MRTAILLFLLAALAVAIVRDSPYKEKEIFFDNFDDDVIDNSVWKHEITLSGGGNWEFQAYVNNRTVSYINNGVLYIQPRFTQDVFGIPDITKDGVQVNMYGGFPDQCTDWNNYGCSRTTQGGNYVNPISSARLRSEFAFRYGRMEVRAKLPVGNWIWPAIWLMPRYNEYGPWPASGEIDVMESRGNKDYLSISGDGGVESFGSTLHFGPYWAEDGWSLQHAANHMKGGKTYGDDYHIFGLFWDEKQIYTYVDDPSNIVLRTVFNETLWDQAIRKGFKWDEKKYDNPWKTSKNMNAPFDHQFYIILNVAVGGTNGYFPEDPQPSFPNPNIPKPWSNYSPRASAEFWDNKGSWLPTWKGNDTALKVDYVRVWGFEGVTKFTKN